MTALAEALVELQKEPIKIGKSETAEVKNREGVKLYEYNYADLAAVTEAIFPKITKLGLSWSCCPTLRDGRFVLSYVLAHTSGEEIGGEYPLPDTSRSSPQEIGSAITYARRYALLAVTGVQPQKDDEDATKAERAHHEKIEEDKRRAERENQALQREERDIWKTAIEGAATLQALYQVNRDAAKSQISGAYREELKALYFKREAELTDAADGMK